MRFLWHKMHNSRNAKGFALIEVVVAVILVGVTFGAIFQAFSQSLRNISRLDAYNMALQLAENKMNSLLIDDDVYQEGVLEGRWNEKFWWKAELEPHDIDDLKIDKSKLSTRELYIRLTVYYKFGNRVRELKLFTIKLVPKARVGERGYLG